MNSWFPILLLLAGLTGLGALALADGQPAGARALHVTAVAGVLGVVAGISTILGVATFL